MTILRDGRRVETTLSSELTKAEVIAGMLGRAANSLADQVLDEVVHLPQHSTVVPVLRIEELSRDGEFDRISFAVAPGECVGLYGFVGAGHQELTHASAGASVPESGSVRLDNQSLPSGDVSAAVRRGVVLVAADRAKTLMRRSPIARNVTLAHLRRSLGVD